MIKSFKNFNEAADKEVFFTFGRFNPPTTGHQKLMDKIAKVARGKDYKIYASNSVDPKKNPLAYKDKIRFMRKMFPKHARSIVMSPKIKTAINIAVELYDMGYNKLTMVVGGDRIKEFESLLKKYNDVKARHGYYNFVNGINVVSAGERDPDATDVTGMSASKMRAAVADGDFKSFQNGLPKGYSGGAELFNALRKAMGFKKITDFREHIQLDKVSDVREQYARGEIFNVGDRVYNKDNKIVTILERKPNYIVSKIGKKYWINDLSEVKQDKDVKDKKGTQPAKYYAKDAKGKEMAKSTKSKRDAHFKKGAAKDDDDPSAYEPAPGDKGAKTKPSKHTLKYKQMFGEATRIKGLYHSSVKKISRPSNKPMFFAIDMKHAAGDDFRGWYYNFIQSGQTAYVYEAKPKGKIAAWDDKKIKKLFEDNNINLEDYVHALLANPSQSEIQKMEGTKLLEKNKFIGLQYEDYDPRDFSKDAEAAIIFNPAKNTTGFKKVRASNESINEDVQLDEKLITFAKKAYPKSGHCLILAGGAGSGKGFVLDNLIGLEGKKFDVDELKKLTLRAPKIKAKIKAETGVDMDKFSLTKSADVGKLHDIVADELNLPNKKLAAFFGNVINKRPEDKPNVIFDVTLKDLRKLDNITRLAQGAMYDKKNIHIVWVVNDIEVAKKQNLDPSRGRVVPVEILVNTHRGASQTMLDIVKMGSRIKKYMDGDIVFAFNKIGVDSDLAKSGKGGQFIKDSNYFYVKRSGKATLDHFYIQREILKKIDKYVPAGQDWLVKESAEFKSFKDVYGEFGTDELTKKYKEATPGEEVDEADGCWDGYKKVGMKKKGKKMVPNCVPESLEKIKEEFAKEYGVQFEGKGEYKGETWEKGYERRVVKTTKPEHKEKGYEWRIKGKERAEVTIKLYKKKPSFAEFKKQMKRVAGHEFGG
jgi:hypothetical protein